MVRVIVGLFVVGMGVIAWVLLLPDQARKGPAATVGAAAAPASGPVAAPSPETRDVRVVYPGPDVGAPVRKLADKVDSDKAASAALPAPSPAAPSPVVDSAPAPAATAAPSSPGPTSPATADPAAPPAAVVNINTASVDVLNQIPGAGRIGRTIASHRPYASIDELVSKRVIRKSVYDKIKDQIAAN